MKILIIDNGTSFLSKLEKLFKRHETTVTPFQKVYAKEANKFDLIVLSGGHKYSVHNHDKQYKNELEIIQKSRKPILGICLGFELIAHNFGCELERLKVKEHGVIPITLQADEITKGMKEINVFESHRWVVKDAGKKLIALGTSPDGIEIIKHKTKPIYGFQFHPEMIRNGSKCRKLFSNVLSKLSAR